MKKEQIFEKGIIKEMNGDIESAKILVPMSDGVDISELVKGDKDPLFVTVEALNPQTSNNGRIWTEDMMHNVAEQIMSKKPDAYQGHLKEADRATSAPTAKTIWLGATVRQVSGKPRLFIKGYVLPYAQELKQYLKAAKASGKKVAVSVYGQAEQLWNKVKKAYDISKFDLESIDWARPGSEGVSGSGYLSIASEMKGELMERKEIIQSVTLSEMTELNKGVVKEITDEVEEKSKKTVSEMSDKLEKANDKIKAYGKITPEVVSEMSGSYDKLMSKYVEDSVASKVDSKSVQSVAVRQVIAEMEDNFRSKKLVDETIDKVVGSKEIKSIISEMAKNQTVINPGNDNRKQENERKYTKV